MQALFYYQRGLCSQPHICRKKRASAIDEALEIRVKKNMLVRASYSFRFRCHLISEVFMTLLMSRLMLCTGTNAIYWLPTDTYLTALMVVVADQEREKPGDVVVYVVPGSEVLRSA